MSNFSSGFSSRPRSIDTLVELTHCYTAHFDTRCPQPGVAVITAHGEIDAANADAFVEYSLRQGADIKGLIVDLTEVEFFGTAGFTALHRLNVRTTELGLDWALVPSRLVTRLLGICDPDAALPVCDSVASAMSARDGYERLLQLVPESR